MVFPTRLPEDVLAYAFSGLDPRSLCRVSRVCKRWRRVADSDRVWQHVSQLFFADVALPRTGIKLHVGRIYPFLPLIQQQYRVTQVVSECWLGRYSVYDPAANILAVLFENHERSICLCPERRPEDDMGYVDQGAVYDVRTEQRLYGLKAFLRDPIVSVQINAIDKQLIAMHVYSISKIDLKTGQQLKKIPLRTMNCAHEMIVSQKKIYAGCMLVDLAKEKTVVKLSWPENIYAYDRKRGWIIAFFNAKLSIYKRRSGISACFSQADKPVLEREFPNVFYPRVNSSQTFQYLPAEQQVICTQKNQKGIYLIDLKKMTFRTLDLGEKTVGCLTCSTRHLFLALEGNRQTNEIQIRELTTLDCVRTLSPLEQPVYYLQYDSESRVLLAGSNQSFSLWDTDTGVCLCTIPHNCRKWLSNIHWDPKGRTIDLHWMPADSEWQFRLIRY